MKQSAITDATFAAFLHCETKAYLFREGATRTHSDVDPWQLTLARTFKDSATEWLRSTVSDSECFVGLPPARILEQGLYRIILDPLLETSEIHSHPDALWLMPSGSETSGVVYSPVRFIRHEKLSTIDKLMLAFDAIALGCVTGRIPRSGKLIHGSQFSTVTVPLAKLLESARSFLTKVVSQQASGRPPLVLNKHCQVCEFQSCCRKVAVEVDDLSLLANMTVKERKKQNDKGIFTVAQLSYTFRARRRRGFKSSQATKHESALKALAIRKRRIHVLGAPNFSVPEAAVYLDVEGVPDRDFYYLVGLRWRDADKDIQQSFWADAAAGEHEMWLSCLLALRLVDTPRLIHYGSYETQFLKRMKERYARGAKDNAFLDQLISLSFNLLSLTYAQIYFPTYTNGLKDVARYLGFEWSAQEGSGLKTLDWRSEWEATRDASLKQKLLTYNAEDCEAVQRVAQTIAGICSKDPSKQSETVSVDVNSLECDNPLRFGPLQYAVPDFKAINEAAYWDYQRSRIYVRSSDRLRRLSNSGRRLCSLSEPPVNKSIQAKENRPALCPKCNSTKFYRNGRFSKVVYDLRFSRAGVRRWVVRHCFNRYHCRNCRKGYNELPRQEMYGKGLKAYVLYQVIELRISQHAVARTVGALFGVHMSATSINSIKISATKQYEMTYRSILQRIVAGPLVHADETQVMIKGEVRYVWVFTSLEDVAYVYSESRNASTAQDALRSFGGVLVSDFYTGYDSINCAQQKCLIHLLRDINDDLLKEPFNEEMKELAHSFAGLVNPIVQTIDRFGLKARYLRRHHSAVDQFFRVLSKREYTTEVTVDYKKRFEKNRDRLFTFLDYDGVPWNNNNAEHAIKAFARLRNAIGSKSTPKGVREYLILLSVSESCIYKGVDFLHFLRSGETDIDAFAGRKVGRVRPLFS
jgi:predicted RecB family nuclease